MGIMLTKKITRAKRILAHLFTFIIIVSSIGNHTIRAYAAEEILLEEASLEADRIAAEQAAAQAEAERIAAEQAAAAHAEAEAQAIAEAERIAQEEAEAAALAEAERFAEEQAEAERIAQEQARAEAGVQENTDPVYDDNVGDGAYSDTEAVNEEYQESATENEITEEGEPGMPHEEEFRVTIFYEASEGGSVSTAEETLIWKEITTTDENGNTTFTQDPEFVTVQGSTAQADEDYEFAGWSLNGEIVFEDESFVPAAPAADVVYQAQFTQSYPAQSWEGETRDVLVSASVEEGVFPAGTVMVVAPIRKQEAIAAAQDMVGEETAVVDAVAVDITFRDKNDQEIQPNGAVNVHLTPKKKLQGESYDAITIDEAGEAAVVEDAEADENGSDIVTEHFTVYGVIGTEEPYDDSVKTQARHTYRFHAGAPTADPADWPVVDTRIVRDGDTLTLPTDPAGDAKHTFAGWFKADTEGNLTDKEVTEGEIKIESAENAQNPQAKDETIDVYAKFSTKYEITLYTDDTKTTVYETHLRDKGESVESLPKKEDDDFDLHIADGSDFIGWKIDGTDDADLVSEVTIDAEHPEDIDLVPVFASINQVKFEVNPANQEGVVATKIPTQNVPFDGTATEPHAFEKGKEYNGYAFQGWFESCDLNDATGEYEYGAEFDFTRVIDQETTLYAKWEPKIVTFRVEIHQEKQDVFGEYALKYTASASETETYGFKGAPGALIDEGMIEGEILRYEYTKRGSEKFHLSRTGVTDDYENDPYAVEIWQDGALVAEYDAAAGAFVSGAEDAKISGSGTTVVKVYESRDTYHIHFLFRDGNTGRETYNATGYTTVKDDHKQYLPDGLEKEGTLSGQVYDVRFKDNMHRTVYLNEVNPQNGADNTVIQKLMDAGWYFKTDYFRKEGGQTVFNHTNKTYNLNPRTNMTDGMDVVCQIYYDPDMVPHPFVFRYYTPDGESYEERGNTTILYSVKDNNRDGKPDNPHSHEYTLFAESAGYKLVKIESGTRVYTSKNINPANGKEQYVFEYDGMTAKPLVLHYEPVAKTITFDPQDGETASFRAVNGAWPAIADQNAFYYGDSYADTVNDPDGAGRYKTGDTKVFANGIVMRFDGWYNNKNGTGEPFDFTDKTMTGSNLTFYGKWTPVECTVIFHPNNGEDDTEQSVTVGTRANRIPNPEKSGETFGGWYLDNGTFEERYDFGTVLDLETVADLEAEEGSKEIHLYAMWNSKQSYTVVYHANGGTLAASLQNALNDDNEDTEKYRGGANASVKGSAQKAAEGSLQYVFIGWSVGTDSDVVLQSGEPFAANSANDLKDGAEDQVIHLYAQFKPMEKKTSVTYHSNYPLNEGDETKTFDALVVNETFEISEPDTLDFTKLQVKDDESVFSASNGCEFRFVRWTNSAGEQVNGANSAGREYFTPGQRAAAGADNNNLYAVWEVVQEYIEISGTKTWEDADNQDGMRPEFVNVTLLAGIEPASTTPAANGRRNPTPVRANGAEGDVWSYQWTNLPKYDATTGEVIQYTVTEEDVPTGYTMEPVTGDMEKGFNITNTHTPATTEVTVTKKWEDANNRDGIRPESVQVQLYKSGGEGEPVAEGAPVTLNESNGWSNTWNDLDKMAGGKDITYTVAELDAEGNVITDGRTLATTRAGQTYAVAITGGKDEANDGVFNYTITNTHEPEVTEINGSKTWSDADNQDGMRPESITVTLLADGEVVATTAEANGRNNPTTVRAEGNDGNIWSYSWTNLPKYAAGKNGEEIQYTVREEAVDGYVAKVDGVNITNEHKPETLTISGEKKWDDADNQDGKRPTSITVNLLAEGKDEPVDSMTVTAEDNWKYEFTDLPKYENGEEIPYSIEEIKVDGYEITTTQNTTGGFDIANKHVPETITISGEKIWDDAENQDGKRPESITVNLRAEGKNEPVDSVTVRAEDDWKYEFTELPKYENGEEIKYSIEEIKVEDYTTTISENATGGFDITNKHVPETITIAGEKIWEDADNQDGIRPESITVNLLAEGKRTPVDSVAVTAEDEWKYEFKDLPKYENGVEIVYSVTEDNEDGYEMAIDGNNITNTHKPETIEISGKKTWVDGDNQDGIRPGSVTVHLFAGEKKVASAEVTAENQWEYIFTELPKFENGEEIVYSITEDKVAGYETTIDGYDITNTHTPETITIFGKKTWDDKDDQDGERPKSITVRLLADEKEVKSVTVRAAEDGSWSYAFADMPKFANGTEIKYSVTEDAISGYSTEITGFDIKNSYTPLQTSVTVTKSWDDANNQDGIRPESVKVQLYADGEAYGEAVTLPREENGETGWTYTWTELDERKGGKKIEYTVQEVSGFEGYTKVVSDNAAQGSASEAVGNNAENSAQGTTGNNAEDGTQEAADTGAEGYTAETTGNAKRGFTITNSHTPEETAVSVEKIWNDANNQDGIRPQSVTVNLYAGEEYVKSAEVKAEDDWKYTFTDLPKNQEGKAITYTVKENEVKGYTTAIAGNAETGFKITNTHEPETLAVSVAKSWDDADNQDGKRPAAITVNLLADGKVVKSQSLTAGGWSHTFTDLPKYRDGGQVIQYTVTEEAVAEYDEPVVAGSVDEGFTITNKHTPETVSVSGTKTWNDANNQDGIRPANVTVNLLADGVKADSATVPVPEEGTLTYAFNDLPKYKDGKEIVYTVSEEAVTGYTAEISGDVATGFAITNTHIPETTKVSAVKTWDDADNQDGKRPTQITVNLFADGGNAPVATANVTAADDWKCEFTDLPKYRDGGTEIIYTVNEDTVAEYETAIEGSAEAGFTITNKHTPETVEVSGTKTWNDADNQDGKRPGSITVNLLADGEKAKSATVTETGGWKYAFTGLPKYAAGTEIVYTVTEDAVSEYETQITGYDITNSYTPKETSVTVTKRWDDANNQDGIRPESVRVQLFADGNAITTGAGSEATLDPDSIITLPREVNGESSWTHTWTNLPEKKAGKDISYTVKEVGAFEGYTMTGITGDAKEGYVITNRHTPATINLSGTKTWNDAENQDGKRPESIKVKLLANGTEVQSADVKEVNGEWKFEFNNLPEFEAGAKIAYTITEEAVDGYETGITGDAAAGFSITNIHTPETIDIEGTKTWDDADNQDGKRPESITVRLLADGTEVETKTVTASEAGEWTYTFNSLPKYKEGKEIAYTVTEDAVAGYTTSINGFAIINTHEPETINISGKKIWDDDDDRDRIRPESVTVRLLADGEEVASTTVTASASGEWNYAFTDLPKYAAGEEIEYTVTEDAVKGYTTEITGDVSKGFTITNSYTPEKVTIAGAKTWDDDDNRDNIRPDSITVNLHADGAEEPVRTATVTAADNWAYSFTDLPKNDKGVEIVYTITEEAVTGYITAITGFDITNTHTPKTIEVSGKKIWDDEDNQDGFRPESVTVRLLADGTEVDRTTVTAENDWTYKFENLPKNNKGTPIVYTVTEDAIPEYATAVNGFDITNTHTPGQTSVTVTKAWNDANNQDGLRPESIEVQLLADKVAHGDPVTLSNDNNWTTTWSELDVRKAGKKVRYTVQEIGLQGYTQTVAGGEPEDSATDEAEGYTANTTGNATIGYVITNTHVPATVNITGTKTWNDAENQDGKRPESITVKLLADGVEKESVTVTAAEDWSYAFEDLPKYSNGVEIKYTIAEIAVDEYTSTVTGHNITNSHTPERIDIPVKKTWVDGNDQDGLRPDSITVNLLANGEQIQSENVTGEGNEWNYSFRNLPKYASGTKIEYTVTEEAVEGYTTAVDGFHITNTHVPATRDITGTKTWNDAENQDGKRPTAIKVTLQAVADGTKVERVDGTEATATAEGGWTFRFDGLPVNHKGTEIEYSVTEEAVEGYTASVTFDAATGFTITNTHTPETTEIEGTKIWTDADDQDGLRPESVTVRLLADGEEADTATVTAEEKWGYKFENLPVYAAGNPITYTITEDAVEGYTTTYTKTAAGYNITNTHVPATIDIAGTKTWDDADDQDGARPESITVRLLANGVEAVTTEEENGSVNPAVVTQDGNWSYGWKNLPQFAAGKQIAYTITEDAVPDYGTTDNGYNFTNTHTPGQTSVTVTKVWDDDDNRDGLRPNEISVQLLADGDASGDVVTLNAENSWTHTWSPLNEKKSGKEIVYTVEEPAETAGYTTAVTGDVTKGFTITNSHTPATTTITGTKTWDDEDNQDGLRPESITVNLLANNAVVKSVPVTQADEWKYEFKDLPVFENGEKITYTISEDKVTGYETAVEGFNITNTHTPETVQISVAKTWNDAENQDGKRPDSVTVNLLADEEVVKTVRLTANGEAAEETGEETEDDAAEETEGEETGTGSWSHTFTGLPKFKDGGQEIKYTVTEETVDGYTTAITGDVEKGYTITNSHTPAVTGVTVKKVWSDADNQDGIRPENLAIRLLADGEQAEGQADAILTEAGEWSHTWENLPKFKTGTEISYTVEELDANSNPVGNGETLPTTREGQVYEVAISSEETEDGFLRYTITNTHEPETVDIAGTKTWDDADDQDGERPASITVRLLADGVPANTTVEANGNENTVTVPSGENSDGSYGWTDLPKYKNGGQEIKYTITEDAVSGYRTEVAGYNITNTHTPGRTSVTVTKTWSDMDNQDGIRPASVDVQLLADGKEHGDAVTLRDGEENSWTHTWTDLAEKKNGKAIEYTVKELTGESGNSLSGYTSAVTGDAKTGYTITNSHTPAVTNVTVKKTWSDMDNQDGIRPENIVVRLFADGKAVEENVDVTLTEAEGWTHTWENLPKFKAGTEITYTVEELDANDNPVGNGGTLITTREEQVYDVAVSSEHTEDGALRHTITNTHTPEVIDVDVLTRWVDENNQDGIRPAAVAVRLFADGVEVTGLADDNATVTVNEGNGWSKKWTGLPKYKDGKPIQYSVKELTAVENGDEIDENGTLPTIRDGQAYAVTYQKNNDYSFVITNTHEPETVEVPVTKTWSDVDNQDGKRPDEVTVTLHADGAAVKSASVTAGGDAEAAANNENTEGTGNAETTESNTAETGNWAYIFTNLPKYKAGQAEAIAYIVTEANVPAGYTEAVTGNMAEGFVITNTHVPEVLTIAGTKTWNDDNDRENVRPDSITVRLYADDNEIEKQIVTPDEDGNWAYSFGEQPRYAAGKEITYTVTENAIAHYVPSFSGFDITNTYTPEKPDDPEDPGDDPEDPEEPVENTNVATRIVTPDGIPVRTVTTTGVTPEAQTEARNLPNLAAIPSQDPADLPTPQSAVPNGLPDPGLPNVMGQTRRTTALDTISGAQVRNINDPEVLGGRRGKTGDGSDASKAMTILAAGMMALALAQKKKRKEDKSEKEG